MKKIFLLFALVFALAVQADDVLGQYSFVGMLGDRIPVRLQFLVLKTTTGYDSLGRFGMGVSFEGVYIKNR